MEFLLQKIEFSENFRQNMCNQKVYFTEYFLSRKYPAGKYPARKCPSQKLSVSEIFLQEIFHQEIACQGNFTLRISATEKILEWETLDCRKLYEGKSPCVNISGAEYFGREFFLYRNKVCRTLGERNYLFKNFSSMKYFLVEIFSTRKSPARKFVLWKKCISENLLLRKFESWNYSWRENKPPGIFSQGIKSTYLAVLVAEAWAWHFDWEYCHHPTQILRWLCRVLHKTETEIVRQPELRSGSDLHWQHSTQSPNTASHTFVGDPDLRFWLGVLSSSNTLPKIQSHSTN